jgi:hypothetical protein
MKKITALVVVVLTTLALVAPATAAPPTKTGALTASARVSRTCDVTATARWSNWDTVTVDKVWFYVALNGANTYFMEFDISGSRGRQSHTFTSMITSTSTSSLEVQVSLVDTSGGVIGVDVVDLGQVNCAAGPG